LFRGYAKIIGLRHNPIAVAEGRLRRINEIEADAIQDETARLVIDVLHEVNPECRGLYPLSAEKRP
jgi:hypothetical protein